MSHSSLSRWLSIGVVVLPWGCAAPAAAPPSAPPAEPPAAAPAEPPAESPGAAPASESPAQAPTPAPSAGAPPTEAATPSASVAPGTPLDARPADPSRSLPEIRVRQVGMHIGGGPNDADSKKPFLKAIEAHNQKYLLCYRLVRNPMQGGTFGVDLFVSPAGGVPDVRATRQRIGGDDFESCMVDAFNGVHFTRPPKPTTLSYSMRFDVVDPSASR